MSRAGIITRTNVTNQLRHQLSAVGFQEIIPQVLCEAVPLEPTIYPFSTVWDRQTQHSPLYLATSPEAYLKQAMAVGIGKCFAVSHAFRNLEGSGRFHWPDFLMLECYKPNADWYTMMQLTQQLVTDILFHDWHPSPWLQLSWCDLWRQYLGVELLTLISDAAMTNYARQKGYTTETATWEQLFFQIAFNEIEPHFPQEPFFLIDFPTKVSPLAKPQINQPDLAERFELIINHLELANGNTELFNVSHIRQHMELEQQYRYQQQLLAPMDETFMSSVATLQGQQWAGVGLGVDRLAMLVGQFSTIQDVQQP